MAFATIAPLRRVIERLLPDRPFAIEFWDGSDVPATRDGGPRFLVRSPRAVAHMIRKPGQLGLGRAYVTGELEVDDLDALNRLLQAWKPPPLSIGNRIALMFAAARVVGRTLGTPRPTAELSPRGRRHTRKRDARAVRHHYDVSNDFFALFLDRSMTYSCAFFSRDGRSLESAQEAKLELTCRKLRLRQGQRLLDVGCGWGSLAIHAAKCHGVDVLGITLSEQQAELARRRVHDAGLDDRVSIRVLDYRDLRDGNFDAIASIGMVEHVGEERIDLYAERLASLLRPGGRLLNHGIAHLRHGDPPPGPFTQRYVFPDADPLHVSRVILALERAGFVTEHVEEFASDYAETCRHWVRRLEENLEEAVRLAGAERVRVWRLYLRVSGTGFETGWNSIYQVQCRLAAGRRGSAAAGQC
jgi:cyclopropane-fatty-acyl-phospholipid synthase